VSIFFRSMVCPKTHVLSLLLLWLVSVAVAGSCAKEAAARLGQTAAAAVVPELCRFADPKGIDQVCNASLHQQRMAVGWPAVRAQCGGLCATVRKLNRTMARAAIVDWAVRSGTLEIQDLDRFLLPPTPLTPDQARLADPDTCNTRFWLAKCPVPPGLPRLVVTAVGPSTTPEWLDRLEIPFVAYSRGKRPTRRHYVYIPGSFGFEAAVYIKFILDCWDQLPSRTAFIHGHEIAYHNGNMTELLRRLRWARHEYANLNVVPIKGTGFVEGQPFTTLYIPMRSTARHPWDWVNASWADLFEADLGPIKDTWQKHDYAQFMASAASIRRWPRSLWLRIYLWLMRGTFRSDRSGRVLEWTWTWLMTGSTNFTEVPVCQLFRCDRKE